MIQFLQPSARMFPPALHLRINPMWPSILQTITLITFSSLCLLPYRLSTLAFSPWENIQASAMPTASGNPRFSHRSGLRYRHLLMHRNHAFKYLSHATSFSGLSYSRPHAR